MRGDFQIGAWTVHPSLNSLERDGKTVHLEPKLMKVLLTLASEPNEVLSHETIRCAVWPDVVVGEDVLVRAIGKIRRAFGDEPVIETIPKLGYRLVASVLQTTESSTSTLAEELNVGSNIPKEGAPEEKAAAPGRAPFALSEREAEYQAAQPVGYQPTRGKRRSLVLGVAALVLIVIFAVLSYRERRHPVQAVSYVTLPFTTDPGWQIQGAFSPDGNSVAYVWHKNAESNEQVYVMPLKSNQPMQLSPEPSASESSPAWSPNGREIAFIRRGDHHSNVMVAPSTGGPAQDVYNFPVNSVREYGGLCWTVDGKGLIFPQQSTLDGVSYLVRLSLSDGTVHAITSPPRLWDGDFSPAISPDGRQIAFIRGSERLKRDVYVMKLPRGPVRRITYGELAMSLTWAADGSSIIFASSKNGTLSLWRVNATGGEPHRMAEVGDDAYSPAISRRNNILIYSHGSAMWGIFSVNLQGQATTKVILTSSQEVADPQISPSGDRIAFQSWRSGSREIWEVRMDGSDPVQITNSPGESAGDPAWSPNGRFIAFDARRGPFAHIYVVNANGGPAQPLTTGDFNDVAPSWSANGKYVFFGSNRSGSWQIWRVAVDAAGTPRQISSDGGLIPMTDHDGNIYFTKNMVSGLWRQPSAGGREFKISDAPPAIYPRFWTLFENDAYVLSAQGQRLVLSGIDVKTNQKRIVYALKYSPTAGLSVSPSGKYLVYSGLMNGSSHLTLVEGFH